MAVGSNVAAGEDSAGGRAAASEAVWLGSARAVTDSIGVEARVLIGAWAGG